MTIKLDGDEEDVEYNAVRAWRDGIAQAMWAHYEILLANEYALNPKLKS